MQIAREAERGLTSITTTQIPKTTLTTPLTSTAEYTPYRDDVWTEWRYSAQTAAGGLAATGELGGGLDTAVPANTFDEAHECIEQSVKLTETVAFAATGGYCGTVFAYTAAADTVTTRNASAVTSASTFEYSTTTEYTSAILRWPTTTTCVFIAEEYTHCTDSTHRSEVAPISQHAPLPLQHALQMGEPRSSRRSITSSAIAENIRRSAGRVGLVPGRSCIFRTKYITGMGISGLRYTIYDEVVQTRLLRMGQQPAVFDLPVSNDRTRHGRTTSR